MCKYVSTGFPQIMHFTDILGVNCIIDGDIFCHSRPVQWHLIERGRGIVPLIGIVLHSVSAGTIRKTAEGTKIT
jgi:hypothetical protein